MTIDIPLHLLEILQKRMDLTGETYSDVVTAALGTCSRVACGHGVHINLITYNYIVIDSHHGLMLLLLLLLLLVVTIVF